MEQKIEQLPSIPNIYYFLLLLLGLVSVEWAFLSCF